MPTIFIGGYYGAENLGDEAILDSMLHDLRQLRSDLSFIVTSWNPEQTSKLYGVNAVHWKDINGILNSGQQADLILLGGGGLFQDYWDLNPETYLRKGYADITAYGSLPLLAELLDVPCMIYAMGLGPLQSELARQHTRQAFEHCQVVSLRDKESRELLEQTGFEIGTPGGPIVEVLADPVFSLTGSVENDEAVANFLRGRQIAEDTELIAVSLRYWDYNGPLMDWLPCIAEGINRYLRENSQVQILLLPLQVNRNNPYTNDTAVLRQFSNLLVEPDRAYMIEKPLNARFIQALIGRCSIILAMRLHALILGINAATPMVALPYDPKISHLMNQAGLEDFCCTSIFPTPEELVTKLNSARDSQKELQVKMQALHTEREAKAKRNAALAVDLLRDARRMPLNFPPKFAMERSRLVVKLDETQEELEKENRALRAKVMEMEPLVAELNEIHSSNFWRLAKLYYRLIERSPLRYLNRFLVTWKQEGPRQAMQKATVGTWQKLTNALQTRARTRILSRIITRLNSRAVNGVFVVTSAFVFDEFFNQRVINLSKYLAKENWGVIYVAWRWGKGDPIPGIGREVSENIFQIPLDFLLECHEILAKLDQPRKYFVVEYPHPEFLTVVIKLRQYNFKTLYEIIDDWGEFHKVGQAAWFNRAFEDSLIINANFLTAVSQPLVERFSRLRHDIHLLPNGFDPALLGIDHHNIARTQSDKDEVNLGYFGHLTDSWFDWDLLVDVMQLATEQDRNLKLHIIGYGGPKLEERLAAYQHKIQLHGKVPPSELYKYVRNWNAAMIPFKSGKLSEAVDPIKVYEYLYFGLPVIVKGISHLKALPGVFVVENAGQFLETIDRLQEEGHKKIGPLDLNLFTWEKRFSELLKILEDKEWMSL